MELSSNPLYELIILVMRSCISFGSYSLKPCLFVFSFSVAFVFFASHVSLIDLERCSVSFIACKSLKTYLNGSLSHFII